LPNRIICSCTATNTSVVPPFRLLRPLGIGLASFRRGESQCEAGRQFAIASLWPPVVEAMSITDRDEMSTNVLGANVHNHPVQHRLRLTNNLTVPSTADCALLAPLCSRKTRRVGRVSCATPASRVLVFRGVARSFSRCVPAESNRAAFPSKGKGSYLSPSLLLCRRAVARIRMTKAGGRYVRLALTEAREAAALRAHAHR